MADKVNKEHAHEVASDRKFNTAIEKRVPDIVKQYEIEVDVRGDSSNTLEACDQDQAGIIQSTTWKFGVRAWYRSSRPANDNFIKGISATAASFVPLILSFASSLSSGVGSFLLFCFSGSLPFIAATSFAFAAIHAVAPTVSERLTTNFIDVFPEPDEAVAEINLTLDCGEYKGVFDRVDHLLGYMPIRDCVGRSSVWTELSQSELERYMLHLQVLEGSHEIGSETLAGVNLKGLMRAGLSLFTDRERIGGSNAFLSGMELALGQPKTELQKLISYALSARLASGPYKTDLSRHQLVARTIVVAQGARGSTFGVPVTASMAAFPVFGKSRFSDLTDAEVCLLAASAQRPLLIVGPSSSANAIEAAEQRFERNVNRAKTRCVDAALKLGVITEAKAFEMRRELERMKIRRPMQSASVSVYSQYPKLASFLNDMQRLDPDHFGGSETHLSVHASSQRALENSIARLDRANLQACFDCSDADSSESRLEIVSVVTDRTDPTNAKIIAAAQNESGLWTGPIVGDNRVPAKRSIASLVKLLTVPHLAENIREPICLRRFANLHDRGDEGYSCSLPEHHRTLTQILAQSSNLGFAEALRISGTRQSVEWLKLLGAHVNAYDRTAQQRRAIVAGGVILSPEDVERAMASLVQGADGNPTVAPRATILKEHVDTPTIEIPDGIIKPNSWVSSRNLLSASVTENHGTLRQLHMPLARRGCSVNAAKTGTVDAADLTGEGVAARLIALSVNCGERKLHLFVGLYSPKIDQSIDDKFSNSEIRTLALDSLDAALKGTQV